MPDTLYAVIRRHPDHTDGIGAFEFGFEAEAECDRLAADGIPAAELEIVPIPVRVGLAVAS